MKLCGSRIHISCPLTVGRSQALHDSGPTISCPLALIEYEYRSRRVGVGVLLPEIAPGFFGLVPTNVGKHPPTEYLRMPVHYRLAIFAQLVYLQPQVFQRRRAQTFSCSLSNLRSLGLRVEETQLWQCTDETRLRSVVYALGIVRVLGWRL